MRSQVSTPFHNLERTENLKSPSQPRPAYLREQKSEAANWYKHLNGNSDELLEAEHALAREGEIGGDCRTGVLSPRTLWRARGSPGVSGQREGKESL